MSFDFKTALAEAQKDTDNKALFLLVLGQSGNGKSYLQGTLPGKTLYLYTASEDHGPKAAIAAAKEKNVQAEIFPVRLDLEAGAVLSADRTLKRLDEVLDDIAGLKTLGITAVVLDSLFEIEQLIRQSTKFKLSCTTDRGSHNAFAEPGATITQFKNIISKLKKIHAEGIHIIATLPLVVREMDDKGNIIDSVAKLIGYEVGDKIPQHFADVVVIGKLMDDQGKLSHQLQFKTEVTKVSKDVKTAEVKKQFNYGPRLTGVSTAALPPVMDADLSKVLALKQGVSNGK